MSRSITFAALVMAAAPAFATSIAPVSYDMINGGGQASGGSYNYWDRNYSGLGSTTTDGAYLSGGLGKLTDGIVATGRWDVTANVAGTGDYVGWRDGAQTDPLITFHFTGAPTISSISIQLDNTGYGGVYGPEDIYVDGVAQSFTNPSGIGTITLSGLSLTGNTHTLQLNQSAGWVFVSEISFDGRAGAAVPEPANWAMMLIGFGAVGAGLRRRTMLRFA